MPLFISTAHLVVQADSHAEACDAISAMLSENLMMPGANGEPPALVEWSYREAPGYVCPFDGSAFTGPIEMPAEAENNIADISLTPYAPGETR